MRPRLQILGEELVDRILDEARAVLETKGVAVEDDEVFARLTEAGLVGHAAARRVTFPRAVVDRALETAPREITLFDRAGDAHARLGAGETHFVPASSALRILDHRTGASRAPKTADFVEYVKVADGLEHLSYLSTAFTTDDVPQDIADVWRLYLALAHSRKPVVSGAFTAWGVERMGRVMGCFRRDRDDLIARPMAIFTCCPNTPLRWGEDPARNLVDCAEWGIPVEVVPVLLLGMISPATTVGALVLHTAEVLSGLTIAQLVRPGAPVLFGGAPATFHMQFMTNPMTAVEALQIYCGYAEIARRLGLPSQAYMALSDSKFNDPQAGAETGIGAMLAVLSGIDSVSGPGMLDYVNCFSLEKLAFDDELVGHARHFARPVAIKEDLPTLPLIDELVAENHLLTAEHTLKYWPEEFYLPGPMVDRTNWDQWELNDRPTIRERALAVIEQKLDDYEEPPLEEALHREIRELLSSTCLEKGVDLPPLP